MGRDRTRVVEVVLPLERLALLLGRQHLVEAVLAEDQHFALPPLHLVLPQQLHDLLAHCGLRAADQRAAPTNRTPIAPPAVPRARSRPHFAAGGAAADAEGEADRAAAGTFGVASSSCALHRCVLQSGARGMVARSVFAVVSLERCSGTASCVGHCGCCSPSLSARTCP